MIAMRHAVPDAAGRVTPDDLAKLRSRLVDMRARLIAGLASELVGGNLALLASVGGALAALDAMPEPVGEPGD